jgi:hypothetical protein
MAGPLRGGRLHTTVTLFLLVVTVISKPRPLHQMSSPAFPGSRSSQVCNRPWISLRLPLPLRGGSEGDIADFKEHMGLEELQDSIRELKSYDKFENPKCEQTFDPSYDDDSDVWLAKYEAEPGEEEVNDEVKQIFQQTLEEFDLEMRAEGNPRWRQELISRSCPDIHFTETDIQAPLVSKVPDFFFQTCHVPLFIASASGTIKWCVCVCVCVCVGE